LIVGVARFHQTQRVGRGRDGSILILFYTRDCGWGEGGREGWMDGGRERCSYVHVEKTKRKSRWMMDRERMLRERKTITRKRRNAQKSMWISRVVVVL